MHAGHCELARRKDAQATWQHGRLRIEVQGQKPSPGHVLHIDRRAGGEPGEFVVEWSVDLDYAHVRYPVPFRTRHEFEEETAPDWIKLYHRDGFDIVPVASYSCVGAVSPGS